MTNDSELLISLMKRVEALEDERAVHALLIRYGCAVDSGDADATSQLYAEDCLIDIDARTFMQGREETKMLVQADWHQSAMPNCAHVMGPYVVEVDGDKATATGYATVYLRENSEVGIFRQSFGRWELIKRDGRWQILKRTSRSTGRDDCQAILHQALQGHAGAKSG
jgi:ketosteroid isomerase-like protein